MKTKVFPVTFYFTASDFNEKQGIETKIENASWKLAERDCKHWEWSLIFFKASVVCFEDNESALQESIGTAPESL